MASRASVVEASASRIQQAQLTGQPCAPVRDLLGDADIALAYEVQQRLTAQRLAGGARVVGRKIGLTSPAVQRQLGVDQPDFGVLFDDMLVPAGEAVAAGRLLQPKAEAEVAFVLAEDLDLPGVDAARARAAVAYAVAALEIVDSRIRDWDIRITDTVADNASSGLFVLGGTEVSIADLEPADVTMTLHKDGALASAGDGRACLGDPLAALAWLARTAHEYGAPLRAGDVVLSGALGPMVAVEPGDRIVADLSTLGRVSATFAEKE